jgi:hypothetical protein
MKGSSTSIGGSKTESHSESIANGISVIEGICRSMGESLSQSVAESCTNTWTHGKSVTFGSSESEQEGESKGVSKSIKAPYMSVDEQARVQSYLIADLPPRHAVVLNRADGSVTEIVTHEIPWRFDTKLGGKDYEKSLLEQIRPPEPVLPEKDVFERVEEESTRRRFHKNSPRGL